MYRCGICQTVTKPGEPRLVHRILRDDGNIEREVPICGNCKFFLDADVPFDQVFRDRSPVVVIPDSLPPCVDAPVPLGIGRKRGSKQ